MKSAFDFTVFPPAPSLEIRLGAPGESLSIGPHRALVDTGADICIVPGIHLVRLDLPVDDERHLRTYGGQRRRVRIYTIDLGVGRLRLPSVECLADDVESELILGRNALNKLVLLLDGPSSMLDIRGA